MALINVTRKAEALQAYQLTTVDDMFAALKFLATKGYGGHINCTSGTVWTLGIQSGNVSQSAVIGDWIVIKNGTYAEVVLASQAASLYQLA
jgi:hypothetical protein